MLPQTKQVRGTIAEGFSPDVIKEKTIVIGKRAISAVSTWPRTPARSPK